MLTCRQLIIVTTKSWNDANATVQLLVLHEFLRAREGPLGARYLQPSENVVVDSDDLTKCPAVRRCSGSGICT